MLTTKKSTTLTGNITIEDKQVVYLNASVSSDGGSDNINQTIQDKALYAANKTEIRKDIAEFTEEFYALQDAEVITD